VCGSMPFDSVPCVKLAPNAIHVGGTPAAGGS
jgi:hypothetical protein